MRGEFVGSLNRFVSGSASVVDFQEWLLANLQSIMESGDSDLMEAADELDADLVQLGEALLDEATLFTRAMLWIEKLQTIPLQVVAQGASAASATTVAGSNAGETTTLAVEYPLPTNRDLRVNLTFV